MLVLVIGTLIGVAEVTSSFPHRAAAALMAPWGLLLVLANALGSVIVYAAVTLYMPSAEHPILRPIAIAVAFAVVIRTRFVLARPLDHDSASGSCSLDLGWPYGRFQRLCREQVRGYIGPDRRSDVAALRRRYPSAGELRRVGRWALERDAEAEEAAPLSAELDRLLAQDVPERLALDQAAELVIERASHATLQLALGGDA
jgi:cell division protein FtsW (lipid II flippase)